METVSYIWPMEDGSEYRVLFLFLGK
jgi:hypothetical protein